MTEELQDIIGPIVREIINNTAKQVTLELQPQITYYKTAAEEWESIAQANSILIAVKEAQYNEEV